MPDPSPRAKMSRDERSAAVIWDVTLAFRRSHVLILVPSETFCNCCVRNMPRRVLKHLMAPPLTLLSVMTSICSAFPHPVSLYPGPISSDNLPRTYRSSFGPRCRSACYRRQDCRDTDLLRGQPLGKKSPCQILRHSPPSVSFRTRRKQERGVTKGRL